MAENEDIKFVTVDLQETFCAVDDNKGATNVSRPKLSDYMTGVSKPDLTEEESAAIKQEMKRIAEAYKSHDTATDPLCDAMRQIGKAIHSPTRKVADVIDEDSFVTLWDDTAYEDDFYDRAHGGTIDWTVLETGMRRAHEDTAVNDNGDDVERNACGDVINPKTGLPEYNVDQVFKF